MSKRIVFVALLAGGLGWLTATWAEESAGQHLVVKAMAKNAGMRATMAESSFERSLNLYQKSFGTANDSSGVAKWSKRVLDARRNMKIESELLLLEQHRDRMRRLHKIAMAMYSGTNDEAEKLDLEEAQYLFVEAECWVNEAKAASN